MTKILIVDDDLMVADCLEELLLDAGYDVCGVAGTYDEAIALAEVHRPDAGVIDLRLADGRYGTEVTAALRQRQEFAVLYATGNPDHELLRNGGDDGYIAKPYGRKALLTALQAAVATLAGRQANP